MSDYPDQNLLSASASDNFGAVPTSARDTLHDPRINLDPATAHAVASALSRTLCQTTSPLIRFTSYLGHMLNRYAVTEVPGGSAALTDYRPARPRDGAAALRDLGMSFEELQTMWQCQLDIDGVNATLPVDVLFVFVAPSFWPVVAQLIADGPGVATERLERLLRTEQGRRTRPTRSRPEGGAISKGQLDNFGRAGGRLMSRLVELHHRGHASRVELAAWSARPRLKVPEAQDGVTDTTAPPLRVLRLAWRRLDADIAGFMRAGLTDQLAVVPSLTARQQKRLFERLRERVLFVLLFCVGARLDAIARLDVADYLPQRRLPDGGSGPAIALRPRKTVGEHEVRYKPLPAVAALSVEVWLAFLELRLGRPQPPSAPLLVPTLSRPHSRWSNAAMRQCIGGASAGPHKQKALLPKTSPYHGYTPHTVRSAVTQGIRTQAAATWLTDKGLGNDAVFQVLIAEALTDHSHMSFDRLGYGGGRKAEDRERLSGYGTRIMWELVTTDRGARRAPDADGFRSALYKRIALEGELAKVRRASTELQVGEPSKEDALSVLLRVQQLGMRKDHLDDELRTVERELADLRHNPTRQVIVPDEVEELPVVDFDAIEREVLGGIAPHRRAALRPVRDWLTLAELAHVLDVGEATVRRWVDGKLPAAERKRPWPRPDEAPIDNTLGVKRRRIAVAGVNPLLLDSVLKRERLAELLSRPPEGWTTEQAAAPLRVGPPAEVLDEARRPKRHLRVVA